MENRPKYEGIDTNPLTPLEANPIIKKKYDILLKKLKKEKMLTGEDVQSFSEIGICPRGSYVYIIGSNDYDYKKIGVATHVFQRMSDLQVGNPFDLRLEAVISQDNAFLLERILHKRFKEFNVRGEWYEVATDDIIRAAKNIVN
jgi:hypothetical protein